MSIAVKGMNLDQRDIKLFQYLHAVKVATYDQIRRDVYSEICFDAVCHRVLKLEDNKLLEVKQSRALLRGKRHVSLRKEGFEEFVRKGNEIRIELKSDAINHDLTLVDIRHRFLKSPKTIAYETENEIQTWNLDNKHLNSDAIVTTIIKDLQLKIPIEYEGSFKKADRYEPFVKKYYQASEFPLVIFVTETAGMVDVVMKTEKKLFNWENPKFFYILINNLLSDDALKVENCNSTALILD